MIKDKKDGGLNVKIMRLLLLASTSLMLAACSQETNQPRDAEDSIEIVDNVASENNSVEAPKDETADEAYKRILAEYTFKIKEEAPKLIAEYNEEAKSNTNGIQGLAELSNSKIMDLAFISNEGIQEMAEVMITKGSGSYSDYEAYATELTNVYMDEGTKITDAYMNSAM